MPSVITTIGGTTSNSYLSVADADTYFDARLNTTDWTTATTDNKGRALIAAARRLNQESYAGTLVSDTQALAWPRYSAYSRDGVLFDQAAIPIIVKNAQAELALAMLASDLLADSGLAAFEQVQVGPLSVTPRDGAAAGALPANVRRELASVLITPSPNNFALVRG